MNPNDTGRRPIECAICGNPSDSWPAIRTSGELCQICWEAESSDAWWRTCAGLLADPLDYKPAATPEVPRG